MRKCKIHRINLKNQRTRRVLIIFVVIAALLIFSYVDLDDKAPQSRLSHKQITDPNISFRRWNNTHKFLIDTPSCKIPEVDPFGDETSGLYEPEEYSQCSSRAPLSYIRKDGDHITLTINQSLLSSYSSVKIFCCYARVLRVVKTRRPDDGVSLTECIPFGDNVSVLAPAVFVSCDNRFQVNVYKNVHAIITPRLVKKERKDPTPSAFSVLLVGIDSISKASLERAMPQTFDFLEKNDFVNLKGYSKIGLNTLPNLMGILGGTDMQQMRNHCDPNDNIDGCYNIWKVFREKGYVTAYGEDSTGIASFNCCGKKGFRSPPTDFYFRPYMMMAERIGVVKRHGMSFCAGPESEGERIMDLAKDFQRTFQNRPKFGLFWMNSFSHDNLNMPTAMDAKVKDFLGEISQHLDNTIFFFFSDHGIRFGDIRTTHAGWLGERLPFFYVHLPDSFKQQHPKAYKNLQSNSKRLTSAFDIYMTLQDVLFFADKTHSINQSLGCPQCHSLFSEISHNRSCEQAAIPPEWCVCNVTSYVNLEDELKTKAALVFVDEINKLVERYKQGYKCYRYRLGDIIFAGVTQFDSILLRVKTNPEAKFEGSFRLTTNGSISQLHLLNVTRIDSYAANSWCIESSALDMFCYCKQNSIDWIKLTVCKYLKC